MQSSPLSGGSVGSAPPPAMVRPHTLPGEFEVAYLTDVIHLNTVETLLGVSTVGSGAREASSHAHATHAFTHTTSAFWKGNLFLTNYALSFVVTEGAVAGHHVSCGGPTLASSSLSPSADVTNSPLLHVPVGAVWKMEYGKYAGNTRRDEKEKEKAEKAAERAESAGDYSSLSSAAAASVASGGVASADSDLKDIAFQLTLHCRDARVLSFGILRRPSSALGGIVASPLQPVVSVSQVVEDRAGVAQEFARLIKKYAFPKEVKRLFAYTYMGGAKSGGDGWNTYDISREFARMGVGPSASDPTLTASIVHPQRRCRWRLESTLNARYEFSPTYPASFWVPADLTERELGKVKSFRSKGRLPALAYSYTDMLDYAALGLDPITYPDTVILRAAQPNVGWTFGRCASDERLLDLAEVRVIIDARPYANAVANQAKGGGYENPENYTECKIEFARLENIHVMRESLHRLLETLKTNHVNSYNTCASTQVGDEFWGALQASGWLKHIRILLEGAIVCANYVKSGVSILVHCSDGSGTARATQAGIDSATRLMEISWN